VGVGNLGRAVLDYFTVRRLSLDIVAAFDTDPAKVNRVVHGVRAYPMEALPAVVQAQDIQVGVLTVPAAFAQSTADALLAAGVRSFLNFAPVPIRMPHRTYVEDMDITTSMEKAAFFARVLATTPGGSHEHNSD
jgi:redox-sensing transcriptional repressor